MALVVSPLTAADVSYQVLFIEVAQTLSRYQPNVAVTRPRLQQTFSYQCIYASMSPRWSSGNPRMLLLIALVLEFESRRAETLNCLLYTSPSPRDLSTSRMPSSA